MLKAGQLQLKRSRSLDLGWAAVTAKAQAAQQLQEALVFTRTTSSSANGSSGVGSSGSGSGSNVGARITHLLQSPNFNVPNMTSAVKNRNNRCVQRVQGLSVLRKLLQLCSGSKSKVMLLQAFNSSVRYNAKTQTQMNSHVHILSNLAGCSAHSRQTVLEAYWALVVDIMAHMENLHTELQNDELMLVTLQAVALDFDVCDHESLLRVGLPSQLDRLLQIDAAPQGEQQGCYKNAAAWALLRLLVLRCVGLEGQRSVPSAHKVGGGVTPLMAELRDIVACSLNCALEQSTKINAATIEKVGAFCFVTLLMPLSCRYAVVLQKMHHFRKRLTFKLTLVQPK
jgi:hypothetical protein